MIEGIVTIFVLVALVMIAIKIWKVVAFFLGLFVLFWVGMFGYAVYLG